MKYVAVDFGGDGKEDDCCTCTTHSSNRFATAFHKFG